MTYAYRAYGLSFESNAPIPGLVGNGHHESQPDISVEVGDRPAWVKEALKLPPCLRYSQPAGPDAADVYNLLVRGEEEFFELTYSDGTRFVLSGAGERIWVAWQPPFTIEDATTYLLGLVTGFVLQRRGVVALHASASCISGLAVTFCGASEAGKSTTAAALGLRGIPALCEDVAALKHENGVFKVESGYARICLWPDAAQNLLCTSRALPRLTPNWEKYYLPLDKGTAKFESQKRPLGAIYVLAPRVVQANAPRIEELSSREALLLLVQNTYVNWLLDKKRRAAEFDFLTKLVLQVPVRSIVPHADPARIWNLCELIIDDVERLKSARTLPGLAYSY